jgi:hypothetical protein
MNSQHWIEYFQRNRHERPEPAWHLAFPEDAATAAKLAHSLSHFQLGESGEGRVLIAAARRTCADDPLYAEALALFVAEEQEHARLLARLVERYGGRLIAGHWTHGLFRLLRRSFGLHAEVQVLVIAELVGTAYYRAVRARARDLVLEQVCELVLRDERAHVDFHAERFGSWQTRWLPVERAAWALQFQAAFLAAALVAWCDHRAALRAIGVKRREFFRAARAECIRFLDTIQLAVLPTPITEAAR